MNKTAAMVMACLLAAWPAGAATTNYVAVDATGAEDGTSWANAWTNIQAAIDASTDGDTILVKQGTYDITNQLFIGSGTNLTIRGGYAGSGAPGTYSTNPALTVVQRSTGNIRILRIDNAGGWIEGMTFRNGSIAEHGAGVRLETATTVFTNCVIRDNATLTTGWGYYNGAGLYSSGGSPSFFDCVIRNNSVGGHGHGHGVAVSGGTPLFQRCGITDNSIGIYTGAGGGLHVSGGAVATLNACTIARNTTNVDGGGIYAGDATVTVQHSLIEGNRIKPSAGSGNRRGAAVFHTGTGSVTLFNCLVRHNATFISTQAAIQGGNVTVANCTVTLNPNIAVSGGSGVVVTNSIVWENAQATSGAPVFAYSCVDDPTVTGPGVTHGDPVFELGYYLGAGSSATNAGSVTAASLGLDTRYAQAAQTDDGLVDLGYHYPQGHILTLPDLYVDAAIGNDGNLGTSPGAGNALKTLTKALEMAQIGTTVNVATGTYNTANGEVFPLEIRTEALRIVGANAENTIISSAGANRIPVSAFNVGRLNLLENLTITGSSGGSYDSPYPQGAGLYLWNSSLRVVDCVIRDNSHGAGLGNRGAGGVDVLVGMPIFEDCVIRNNNYSDRYVHAAAGVMVEYAVVTFIRCVIRDNTASHSLAVARTGGIEFRNSPYTSRMINCLIVGNSTQAGNFGHGVRAFKNNEIAYTSIGRVELENCTIVSNVGRGVRGNEGTTFIRNGVVVSNGLGNLESVTSADVRYSLIGDAGFAGQGQNGNLDYDTDPAFVDTTYYHLQSRVGDYRGGYFSGGTWGKSAETSPLIDAGDPAADWSNEPDYPNGHVNIGAYGNTAAASRGPRGGGAVILVR